ncbi:MAG: hypothetical protein U0694_02880 [Anaerolineae bacterium]
MDLLDSTAIFGDWQCRGCMFERKVAAMPTPERGFTSLSSGLVTWPVEN